MTDWKELLDDWLSHLLVKIMTPSNLLMTLGFLGSLMMKNFLLELIDLPLTIIVLLSTLGGFYCGKIIEKHDKAPWKILISKPTLASKAPEYRILQSVSLTRDAHSYVIQCMPNSNGKQWKVMTGWRLRYIPQDHHLNFLHLQEPMVLRDGRFTGSLIIITNNITNPNLDEKSSKEKDRVLFQELNQIKNRHKTTVQQVIPYLRMEPMHHVDSLSLIISDKTTRASRSPPNLTMQETRDQTFHGDLVIINENLMSTNANNNDELSS